MKIKDLDRIDRPRERLGKYGPSKLSTPELLAIVLRTGTRDLNVIQLANKILKVVSGNDLSKIKIEELRKIKGVGEAKACEIIAVLELGSRLLKGKQSVLLLSPRDVWNELKDIRGHKKEHFIVFFLDSRNQEIKREIISIGTLNSNLVHPREVFEPAIKNNTAQIIVAHNHPSNDPEPSPEDVALTERLAEAGRLLGIELLDHIVISKTGYVSLRERKII